MSKCDVCGADATQEAQFKTISLFDRGRGVSKGDIFNQTAKTLVCDECSDRMMESIKGKK